MAKPNAQTGHSSISGGADESALPNGEAPRRGADGSPDANPKADWGLPDSTDESSISRILGLILVLVLVGVFSFIAYRKYNEARLHPQADPIVADKNGSPAATPSADLAPAAANTSTEAPNAPQQLEEPSNSNAAFHPTSGGSSANQSAGQSLTGQPVKPAQTASSENEANPFSDVASPATPATGSNGKVAQPDANHRASAAAKSLAADDPRTDQSEPFLNEGSGQHAPSPAGRVESRSDSSIHQKLAAVPKDNGFPNENEAADAGKAQMGSVSGRSTALQPQPVQTTQKDQSVPTRQTAPAQNVLSQSEPATNDLLNDSPRTGEVARNEHPSTLADSTQAKPNAHTGGLLDQDEPESTTAKPYAKTVAAPVSSPTAGATSAPPQTLPETAQAATSITVHAAQPQPAADTEDLFAAKRTDVTTNGSSAPIPQRQAPTSLDAKVGSAAGNTGAEVSLNEAGDFYVVQPQDTFWTISRKKYGTARYFNALAQLNKAHVPDPTRMRPGVKVSTPPTEILETRFAQYLPRGSAIEVASGERQATKPAATGGYFVTSDGKPMYRTGEKDTLSDIAARHLGRASRWIQVFEMNRDKLNSPNQLKVGTELVLPADASNVALTNDNDDRR
jgi:nucleoid-associated protein YgaU